MSRAEHGEAASLQTRLDAVLGGGDTRRTVIARCVRGRRAVAAIGCDHEMAEDAMFRTGCATKLLVAALLERKLDDHGLRYDSTLRSVLGGAGTAVLHDVTIRHLLEHTHGLDDSHVAAAPLREDGCIDVERLLAALVCTRRAAPGARYSYSNAGAFLVAAALEARERRPIAVQLRNDLLMPLGLRVSGPGANGASVNGCRVNRECGAPGPAANEPAVCPATGGDLRLAVGDWLTFLDVCAARRPLAPAARGTAAHAVAMTALSGWHPLEQGIRLGWKCYAGGWFGHQSVWPGASLLLCVRPAEGSSLVVASASHPAAVVAMKVVGRELPELLAPALPKRAATAPERLDFRDYGGTYALAAERLEIAVSAGTLILRESRAATRLVAAGGELFFLEKSHPGRAFVQFIDRGAGGRFLALWDGRRVYPLED